MSTRKTKWGRYKLAVYFHDHQQPAGRPYYYRSNESQDRRGQSIRKLSDLVTNKWRGKVSWAGLYENDKQISEFRETTNEWKPV